MTVGKRDAAGAIVIAGREIHQLGLNLVDGKIAVIDAVGPLVESVGRN